MKKHEGLEGAIFQLFPSHFTSCDYRNNPDFFTNAKERA